MCGTDAAECGVEESDLARSAAGGLRTAQRDLLHRLGPKVHETLYYIIGSNEQMEELLEGVFIEIFRSLSAYDRKLDLNAWACSIAVRCVCRHLRNKRRAPQSASARASGGVPNAGSGGEDPPGAASRQLYGLFRQLEPEQHVTLALALMGQRSIRDIATLMNVSTWLVRARLRRARRLLNAAARGDSRLEAIIALHTESL
jgi:RNA polymerase sigma-70 factor (ECF subfamily)